MARLRLFVALTPPLDVRNQMSRLIQDLETARAAVRWEGPGKLHCTLKFLGDTDDGRMPGILAGLSSATQKSTPTRVTFEEVGAFPTVEDPRVLWIGMSDPDHSVKALQQNVEAAMAGCGFDPEPRPFHAHVTLGRLKGRTHLRELTTRLKSVTFQSRETTLAEIELIRSDLRPSGSVYTPLRTFRLGPPEH